jgi:hypothetical protein
VSSSLLGKLSSDADMTKEDAWMSRHRCHGVTLGRMWMVPELRLVAPPPWVSWQPTALAA